MISIIICTYNRADLLPKAIGSVLSQSFKDFEVIIIDDHSTDNTESVVKSFSDNRIKYYKNDKNLGIAKSRNKGISLGAGEYIAMLDSDDYWLDDDKLKKQLAILESGNNIGIVGTGIRCINEKGDFIKNDLFLDNDADIRNNILFRNQFAQSSVVFRKEAFLCSGGYDETIIVCDDLDLWLRIGLKYKFYNIPEICVAYLVHPGGISKYKKRKMSLEINGIINRHKKDYPNYFKAKIKSILRIILSL